MMERKQTKNAWKKSIRNLNICILLLGLVLCIVISFTRYQRYEDVQIYSKPPKAAEQKKTEITSDAENKQSSSTSENSDISKDGTKQNGEKKYEDSFTLYLVGDEFVAEAGNGVVTIDVRNQADSTHDIDMRWLISRDEMEKHGININGMTDDEWTVLETGLFEPGYSLDTGQLLALPDGSFLPAGKYNLTLSELYYHHETGALSSYESRIPITLEVKN